MKLTIGFIVICVVLYAGATTKCPETTDAILETPSEGGTLGHELKMLLKKLTDIERIVLKLRMGQHELQEQIISNQAYQTKTYADIFSVINRLDDRLVNDVGQNMTVLQDKSMMIQEQQKACSKHDQLGDKKFTFESKNHKELVHLREWTCSLYESGMLNCVSSDTSPAQQTATNTTETPRMTVTIAPTTTTTTSCKEVPLNVSGVYLIHISNNSAPFQVYCEMEKLGGGWIVVQHRFNGSVDFYRNWDRYRDGFGDLESEFWLGLEKMHQITKSRNYELVVEIKDFSGKYGYARYDGFQIGSESEEYRLKNLGSYSGTVGDPMTGTNKGMKFSTNDRENDVTISGCAQSFYGAWWYNGCTYANLNGMYKNVANYKSMHWYSSKNNYDGLSFSRMMIRELL
ncbi:ficolin-1-like [Anopheles albimanus]|uniref:ficolin-1-like n=1 Tax=Anopheles albimanus TaxID=7167 RepID=UPI00164082A8|nr:ficolin-1-like [Anopheles albimanus]